MNHYIHKVFISLLISSSILLLEVISQTHSNCPSREANLTDGVTADLNTDADGVSLLGIRVVWSIKPKYLSCQFGSSRVVLIHGELEKVVNVTDGTAEFTHDHLDCNRQYRPTLRVVISGLGLVSYDGTPVFYGGTKKASPSQLLRVCVVPLSSLMHRDRVNISWYPLPCHLQNGADITGYIIQYTRLSTGEVTDISSSDSRLGCHQESGGPYSCVVTSLFLPNVAYSIRIAAQNTVGVSSFSNPVISTNRSLGSVTNCTSPSATTYTGVTGVTGGKPTTAPPGVAIYATLVSPDEARISKHSTCQEAGVVITILLIVNYMLWKRLRFSVANKQSLHEKSHGEIDVDMKECSAYGQLTSPQTMAGQQHAYESTT